VGLALAPAGWMATLPVTGLCRRFGAGGHAGGADAGALGPAALVPDRAAGGDGRGLCARRGGGRTRNFWLLLLATVVAGFYAANAALYRFAGPELVAPAYKERAISFVLAGGIVGAFIGPNLASWTKRPAAGALCRRLPGADRRGHAWRW
jgi:hypothetical protein